MQDTLKWFKTLHEWRTRPCLVDPHDIEIAAYAKQDANVELYVQNIKAHWADLQNPNYARATPWNPTARPAIDLLCTQPWDAYFIDHPEAIGRSHRVEHLPRYLAYVETVLHIWVAYFGGKELPALWETFKTELSELFAQAPEPLDLEQVKAIKIAKKNKKPPKGKKKTDDEVHSATFISAYDEFAKCEPTERKRRRNFATGLVERILFALLLPPPAELDDKYTLTVRVLPTPDILPTWWDHTEMFKPALNEVRASIFILGATDTYLQMLRWLDEWYDFAHDSTGVFRPTDRLFSAVCAVRRWIEHNDKWTTDTERRLELMVSVCFAFAQRRHA